MSTTTSPLPSRPDVHAFKDHTHCDPVLPSSPEDEQLTPVPTSQDTPGSQTRVQTDFDAPLEVGEQGADGMGPQNPASAGYGYVNVEDLHGYNDYLFSNNDFNYFQETVPAPVQEEPSSATTNASRGIPPSRRSTGIATLLSSHLMSPELSDATSPASPDNPQSPVTKTKLLGGGPMSRASSQTTAVDSVNQPYMQQTPAHTGTSANVSPDPGRGQSGLAAPLVHVESYSRGDSPARPDAMSYKIGSKRGRGSQSSLHLAPERDSSEDGHYEEMDDAAALQGSSTPVAHAAAPRLGVDPNQRGQIKNALVQSLDEQTEQKRVREKNQEVSKWLEVSNTGATGLTNPDTFVSNPRGLASGSRLRAKSASGARDLQTDAYGLSQDLRAAQDAQIPGPGALLNVESDEGDDDEDGSCAESAPASIDGQEERDEAHDSFPTFGDECFEPEATHPWMDPLRFPSKEGSVGQPVSSNFAMMQFAARAKDIETASRAATWGTSYRRLSDGDLQQVFGNGGLFSRLSISKDKDTNEWRQFKETVEQAARKVLPKRNNSNARRKQSEPVRPMSRDMTSTEQPRKESIKQRKESLQSLHERTESLKSNLKRIPSVNKRPKSPKLNTSTGGLIASATNVAALGANGPVSPTVTTSSPASKLGSSLKRLNRHSSHDTPDPGLTDLWGKQGGPPLPSLSSPPQEIDPVPSIGGPQAEDEDAESEEGPQANGVSMNLASRPELRIIPNFEGFKAHVKDVNPRLPLYLVERLGQEQLRRYKKLIDFKVKHAQARQLENCESGARCVDKGGVPTYFLAKSTQKEPALSHTGFTAAGTGELDEDEEAVADGAVTEAHFPHGVPLPPVKRLPAEFECPLCFTVKKFHKPSDWSKHVHEDLQPFTCTFHSCPDPKSFKRKADWVRHENERHRQLEWWQCTEDGCQHQCYRRDNFVQHLVREHKMPEPKAKTTKPNKPAVRGPAKNKGRGKALDKDLAPEDKVLVMVETCRHETKKNAMEEACRFCGNICNSWKKLTVHLARHMEQISMPVLELVKVKDVTADTIISPIEANLPQVTLSPSGQSPYSQESISVSPFDRPVEVSNAMADLPGTFAPLHGGQAFAPAPYSNQMPWNPSGARSIEMTMQAPANASNNHPMAMQPSHMYGRGLEQAWMTPANGYTSDRPVGYVVDPAAPEYAPQNSTHDSGIYGAVNGTSTHGTPISYTRDPIMPVGMDSQRGSSPSYINQNPTGSQVHQQVRIPIQYDPKRGSAFPQSTNDTSLYQGHQPQQSQQQQQHHQQSQQQQQQQSQHYYNYS